MTLPITEFTGNVVADSELRYTNNGKPVLGFRIATDNSRYDPEARGFTEPSITEFITCSWWGYRDNDTKLQNWSTVLVKGARVHVVGKNLHINHWSAQDGEARSDLDVAIDQVYIVPKFTNQSAQNDQSEGDPWNSKPANDAFGGGDEPPPF